MSAARMIHLHLSIFIVITITLIGPSSQNSMTSMFESKQFDESVWQENPPAGPRIPNVYLGAIIPKSNLLSLQRMFFKRISDTVDSINNNKIKLYDFTFTKHFRIGRGPWMMMNLEASPMDILNTLCKNLLAHNVITVIYLTNNEIYQGNAASVQYLLQLTGYLGLPVIGWNVDNVGLEKRVTNSKVLQMAPSVEHQAEAMLSILRRYSWHSFAVVTTKLGGHEDFVRALRDLIQKMVYHDFKFTIVDIVTLKGKNKDEIRNELEDLADSEARIMLLFATRDQAKEIMTAATDLGLTSKNYVWIASQTVVGTILDSSIFLQFPIGML
ncbi:glutamate receptor ionotropic, NMDA 2B-like, partial [Stegodyphus dumicola]|uniref:glutamate receptor ionotropic, NMDA 2B-like n=1 Tax=Stegodyphus dumicola TaxID=202533 RepID=UPI0015A91F7A